MGQALAATAAVAILIGQLEAAGGGVLRMRGRHSAYRWQAKPIAHVVRATASGRSDVNVANLDALLLKAHDRLVLCSKLLILLCSSSTHCEPNSVDRSIHMNIAHAMRIFRRTSKAAVDEVVRLARLLVLDEQRVFALQAER